MDPIPIRLMKDRRYESVPVDQIVVPFPRIRQKEQFAENVRSIRDVGLLKPILLNERFLGETGKYELICGEGRLTAHKQLEKPEIQAEIIDCDRKEAYLMSLIENIARVRVGSMWFAQEVKRMRDAGMACSQISLIVGKSESYITALISLVERGEERLIRGVEQGIFPMSLALQVMESDQSQIRNLLMDAYDTGVVTTGNIRSVRKLIEIRMKSRATKEPVAPDSKESLLTVEQLKEEIAKTVHGKESFVREANAKEGRLVSLMEGLEVLRSQEEFVNLLRTEGLAEMPQIKSFERGPEPQKEGAELPWTKEPV